MFQFYRAARINLFEKVSIAWDFARARSWARAQPRALLDKDRPTVGEMVERVEKRRDVDLE